MLKKKKKAKSRCTEFKNRKITVWKNEENNKGKQ